MRAMMDIAAPHPTERMIVSEIAKRQDIPPSFLAKIVPLLARAGLVRTSLGATGGVTLAASPKEISLLQIIEAIDGPLALNLCSLNPSDCRQYVTCAACQVWGKAQAQLNQTLAQRGYPIWHRLRKPHRLAARARLPRAQASPSTFLEVIYCDQQFRFSYSSHSLPPTWLP